MRRFYLTLVAMTALAGAAQAQFQTNRPIGGIGGAGGFGQSGPTVSPYINLLRTNGSALSNYYGIVRPELQARQQIAGLAEQQNYNTAALNGLDENAVYTGTAARFLNTQPYFQSFNRGNGVGAGQGVVTNPINRGAGAINASNPFAGSGLNGAGGRGAVRNQGQ